MSTDTTTFEAECRALYERHGMAGFFSYMTPEGRMLGNLSAQPDDRLGTLLGTQDVVCQLVARQQREAAAAEAPPPPTGFRCSESDMAIA